MANQVTVNLKTSKGQWETTFQKSTRVKDVILALRVHYRFPKTKILVLCKMTEPPTEMNPDRALVNYNIKDGDSLLLNESDA